ncbi:MAG: zinc ribbon domain-containing protein [Caldilineae bacterium]|nr:MAG: zinc ribbon domain-containing protein [Caldilineae bacterium]
MAQKKLGYVELEWVCPNCGNRNPGPEQKCGTCGAPQPEDVEFIEPQVEELISDEEEIAAAQLGPDIHCPYCGARNRADAEQCRNCGAPLDEGTRRQAGRVVGAFGDATGEPITCPACGTENPPDARRCQRCGAGLVPGPELKERARRPQARPQPSGLGRVALMILLGVVAIGVIFIYLATRTQETVGVVADVAWKRSVVVEALVPVQKEAWLTEIPPGVEVGQCRSKVARVQDEPAPNAVEVCGTPYTVDTGSGYGEVVQDCQYQIYEEWCTYTVEEWRGADTVIATGEGLTPQWPALQLAPNQRPGERREEYIITFETDGQTYKYVVRDPNAAAQFQEGSRWALEINTFGALTQVKPLR